MDFEKRNKENICEMLKSASEFWEKESPLPNSEVHNELIEIFKFKKNSVIKESFRILKSTYTFSTFPKPFNWRKALKEAEESIKNNVALINYQKSKDEEDLKKNIDDLSMSAKWHDVVSKIEDKFISSKFYYAFDEIKPLNLNPLVILCKNQFCQELLYREFFLKKDIILAVKKEQMIITKNCKNGAMNIFTIGDMLKKYNKNQPNLNVQQNLE
jgi:hypothetical protein